MPGFEIWADTRHNRLHVIIHRTLNPDELRSASLRLEAALDRLRPGMSINVSQAPCKRVESSRIRRNVTHLLTALDTRLAA
jgi:hypothetical protein